MAIGKLPGSGYSGTTAGGGSQSAGGAGGGGTTGGGDGAALRGGAGVVILRYADTYSEAANTTGSPTITVAGGYRVYKFTGSGTITF